MSDDDKRPPIEVDTYNTMRALGEVISQDVAPGYGFMVLIFPFGGPGKTANYISNCKREDMIKALREKADVLEAGLDIEGTEPDA